eukprot:m.49043 g.49043  ORF g.49043 m.49043 type:complete len:117 (-) comp12442_c1_seq3:671-1021(-)
MGVLLSTLFSLWGKEEQKVIIVGLDNAGKTTILYQYLLSEVVVTSPTIGSNVEEADVDGLSVVCLFFLDLFPSSSLLRPPPFSALSCAFYLLFTFPALCCSFLTWRPTLFSRFTYR